MRLWIKDPVAILAPGAERGVVVEEAKIVECVGRGQSPAAPWDATFNASRHVVLPGLVNAHHHFYQTLTRAHPDGFGKELIPWLVAMEHVWGRMTPEALRIAVRMALVELLLSGCTTAADHHNLFPPGLENAIDIEVEEATKLGLRMTVTRGSMGISEKDGGLQPDAIVQDSDTILEDSERVLRLFHDPNPGAMIRVALAPCSPLAVPKRVMEGSAALAERYDCRLHMSSLPVARRGRLRRRDVRHALGRSSGGGRLAHAPHLGRARHSFQRGRNRAAGPGGGRRLPLRRLRHGVRHGRLPGEGARGGGGQRRARRRRLGVEQFVEHDGGDPPFADAPAPDLRAVGGDALRRAALGNEGSARCLGRDDIGAIAVGMQADLALFTLDEPRFSGAQDPIAALVLCGAHRADRVMIAGRWRVIDGQPEGVDLAALIAKHKAAARAFA